MNTNVKKALLIFGGGFLVYWAFTKIIPIGGRSKTKKSDKKSDVQPDKKNAIIALRAYGEAMKAGENKQFLDEMNSEFTKQYNLKIYTEKGSGKLFAADLDGNKII